MERNLTERSIELQTTIRERLQELGYADPVSADRVSRHLAEIAIQGEYFSSETLPLFLNLDPDNLGSLRAVFTSMKCDLAQIGDAVSDLADDLEQMSEFLHRRDP